MSTIFKKIIDKEIPANIVYEDEEFLAFHDINPAAKVHVLVIPKKEIKNLGAATEELWQRWQEYLELMKKDTEL